MYNTSQNSSIDTCPRLGDIHLYLQHLEQYQTLKVLRLKITLSVTMCFVSSFFKMKLASDFCVKLSHYMREGSYQELIT